MRKLLLLIVASIAAVGLATAAPIACTPPPPPLDVLAPGFSYTCGGLTFSNFSAMPAQGNFTPTVSLAMASYDPDEQQVKVTFNPNLIGTYDFWFWFEVSGAWVDKVNLGVGPFNNSVTETVCSSSFGGSTICPQGNILAAMGANGPGSTGWVPLSTSSNHLYIFKDVGVVQGALSNFEQGFHVVPEPLTFLLMGSGLLGLGLLRRVRR